MENKAYYEIAMDLSNGMFAWHLFGVLTSLHESEGLAPDLEEVALEYLRIYHHDSSEYSVDKANSA